MANRAAKAKAKATASAKTTAPHVPPGRRFTHDELAALVAAWDGRNAARLAKLGAAAGIRLTLAGLDKLAVTAGQLERTDVLATLGAAIGDPAGFALEEWHRGGPTSMLIAAIDPSGARVIAATASNKSHQSIRDFWPQLVPWSNALARNRPRVDAWLAVPSFDRTSYTGKRVSFDLVPLAAPTVALATRDAAPDLAQLYAAILADPDDDSPRLVLADLLQQRGDLHGELIAVQCRLAKLDRDRSDERDSLRARERELLDLCGARVAGIVADHASDHRWSRGFIDTIKISTTAFAKHGAAIVARHPITTLTPSPITGATLATLAATPSLAHIRNLRIHTPLSSRATTSVTLAPLGASAHLAALERLSIWSVATTPADWRAAFATLRAPRLVELEVHTPSLDLAALARLLDNPGVPALACLSIDRDRKASKAGAGVLFDALARRTTLRDVMISDRIVDGDAIERWFAGPGGRALEILHLQGDTIDDRVLTALANAGPCALRVLAASGYYKVTQHAVVAFLTSPAAARLERIMIHVHDAGDDLGARLAAALPRSRPLRCVEVSRGRDEVGMPQRFAHAT